MPTVSELQPVNPASIPDAEKETEAPWIVRKLAGSMTGRIVMSSYESLRAAGTSVICLSPWGDSSPLLLPCIRFRDLALHMVIVATGGTAAIAAPVMGPVSDVLITSLGDSIVVELGLHAGFDLGAKVANDLLIEHPISHALPANDRRLYTTAIKSLTITLKYKHTMTDAALGFFRSSIHADASLFSSVKEYLAVEKGWFSPFLFASGRRPIIPRTMTPDVVFCHGPFLGGDYKIGETLLNESAIVLTLCDAPPPPLASESAAEKASQSHLNSHSLSNFISKTTSKFSRSRPPSPSPSPSNTSLPTSVEGSTGPSDSTNLDPSVPVQIPSPRRMVLVVLGIKPHRHYWTTSARPGESVIEYILLNGCPAVVIPVQPGSPLLAWDTLTLEQLHKIGKEPGGADGDMAKGIVNVIYEYLGLCIDWERTVIPGLTLNDSTGETASVTNEENVQNGVHLERKKAAVRDAVRLLVTGAIRSGESKEATKKVDLDRAGIVMFRIP